MSIALAICREVLNMYSTLFSTLIFGRQIDSPSYTLNFLPSNTFLNRTLYIAILENVYIRSMLNS